MDELSPCDDFCHVTLYIVQPKPWLGVCQSG